jgi:hypothetical protein
LFCECVCSEFLHPVRLFSLRTEKLVEHVVATCSASSCTTALARVEILTRDQSVVGHHRRAHRKLRNHGLRELGSKTWERFLRLTRINCFGHRQPTKREFRVRVAELSGANPSPEPPGRGHWALCRPPPWETGWSLGVFGFVACLKHGNDAGH